jgi:hypothetical protein
MKTREHANRRVLAERETIVAVPLRASVCGLPGALSVIESVPVRLPETLGEKVTLMVQLAPGATPELQLSLSAKLVGEERLEIVSGAVP